MKQLIVLFLLLVTVTWSTAQENWEAFESKGKWGFKEGKKTVIKPRYDGAASFLKSSPHTLVRMGNKQGVIDRQGNWYIKPVLDSVLPVTFPHNFELDNTWTIAYGKEYDYILDSYSCTKLDSFPEIQREIMVREKNPDFNMDYSDPKDEYRVYTTIPEEPYVIVSRFDERKQPESAVYELKEHQLISPWVPLNYGEVLSVETYHYDTVTLHVYSDGEKSGYYMTGRDYGTPLKFSDFIVEGSFILVREARTESTFQLYEWTGKHLVLLSGTNTVSVSREKGSARYYYQLEDGNGAYGFVSMGGKVIEPQYDSLFRMPGYSDILHTKVNGLYGLVSMASDYEARARSLIPIQVEGFDYSLFNSGMYVSYTDEKGKKWFADITFKKHYDFNPKYIFPKAEKGFYYLASVDTVAGKRVETKVLQTKFLKLEKTNRQGVYIAQGMDKKCGVIQVKGDTLFPFVYDDLDLLNYDGDVFHYISVRKNKKEYLYHWYRKEIIDIPFDDIKQLSAYSHELSRLFVVGRTGNSGLFNANDSSIILPMEFDEIYAQSSVDKYGDFLIGKKNAKHQAYFCENQFSKTKINTGNSKDYDLLFRDRGYIRIGDQFEEYNMYTHEKIRMVSENEILWTVDGITIFYENGKFGVRNSRNDILFPAVYDKLYFSTSYQSDLISGTKEGQSVELNTEDQTEVFR